jgi:hypothetical protein
VVGLSTVVVTVVVVDSDGPIEDVRDVELVKEPADVDADVVIEISDEVSVFVEDVTAADVDVTFVDTTAVGVVDVELAEVGDSSEVLDNDVTADVEAVVADGVANVVGVVEDSISVVLDVGEVDDVSVSVEDAIAADVDDALVDTTSVDVVDVELREFSEVLEKEVTGDVDSVVTVGVVRAVGVLDGSIDVADELGGVSVCDSTAGGAADVDVGSRVVWGIKADVKEELTTVELPIC